MKESLNLKFRFVKIADIIYISILSYFIIYFICFILNKQFGEFNREKEEKEFKKNKNHFRFLLFKGLFLLIISAVILYIFRNIFELIPSPFNGLYGFEHKRVKELEAIPVVLFFIFFSYQWDLLDFLGRQYNIL